MGGLSYYCIEGYVTLVERNEHNLENDSGVNFMDLSEPE